jgi:50S ribosomal protein L16 3-hydroxylase
MDVDAPLALLGGLSPAAFMRRHWQRRPLLVRQAWPGVVPPLPRAALMALAAREDVESRLVLREGARWQVRRGPLPRRALPPLARPGWTLLVQGLDLHVPAAHEMLSRFRFVPDARLDDLMVSWASPGGGVGPHLDSYDVFLLQLGGRRRWRIGPVRSAADERLVEGAPLKLLADFRPQQEWVLEPGDLLYLPPRWGHDGVAEGGDCMTGSIGFRAPAADELAAELLQRLADEAADDARDAVHAPRYRDAGQPAVSKPAAIPPGLLDYARRALARRLADPQALARVLGESLSEPKPAVWFEQREPAPWPAGCAAVLDRRTRMLHDARHVFINGQAYRAGGRDARLMHELADRRRLAAAALRALGEDARALIDDWRAAGWLHAVPDEDPA